MDDKDDFDGQVLRYNVPLDSMDKTVMKPVHEEGCGDPGLPGRPSEHGQESFFPLSSRGFKARYSNKGFTIQSPRQWGERERKSRPSLP